MPQLVLTKSELKMLSKALYSYWQPGTQLEQEATESVAEKVAEAMKKEPDDATTGTP